MAASSFSHCHGTQRKYGGARYGGTRFGLKLIPTEQFYRNLALNYRLCLNKAW